MHLSFSIAQLVQIMSFLVEEVDFQSDSEEDNEEFERFKNHDAISESLADYLYAQSGCEFVPSGNETGVTVLSLPSVFLSSEESLISEAKMVLGIGYCLEGFQIQALLRI